MRQIKFRAWKYGSFMYIGSNYDLPYWSCSGAEGEETTLSEMKWEQFTGLTDKSGVEFYVGSIGEFENGDRFVLKMEDWLEIYVDWVGDAECEDQARDLYRIERAKVIGNIHQNPELLESKQ